jgi:hypothetical protein
MSEQKSRKMTSVDRTIAENRTARNKARKAARATRFNRNSTRAQRRVHLQPGHPGAVTS